MLVGTAIRYGLDGSGLGYRPRAGDFLISKTVQTASIAHPSFCSMVSLPGVKQLRPAVYHSLPSTADFKNVWSYTSAPPICPHGLDRDNLTFTESLRVTVKISVANLP